MIRPRPAGFWIRVLAALIDILVFVLVRASLRALAVRVWHLDGDGNVALRGAVAACTTLFVVLYLIALPALTGQTIGKLVTRVRVVGADGAPPPVGTAVLRFIGYGISLILLGFGFVMAGLRADRRALHDLLAGTRVERLAPTA